MKLTKNVHIDGVWYGPDYGDQDLPPEVEARLGQPSVDVATANNVARVRSLLMSGVARLIEEQVIPAFARLPLDEQAAELEAADGEFAQFIESVAGKLATAPAPAPVDEDHLADDDVIVVAKNRYILRGHLVAILDQAEAAEAAGERIDAAEASVTVTGSLTAAPDPVDDPGPAEPPAIEVPEGSVDDLLAFVHGGDPGEPAADGWRDRATAVLAVELQVGGHPRKTLIEPLERALDADEDEVT